MKANFNIKYSMVLLVIVLMSASAFFFSIKSSETYTIARVKKTEDNRSQKTDSVYNTDNLIKTSYNMYKIADSQILDDMDFRTLFLIIRNMSTLFSSLISLLAIFNLFSLFIKQWLLSECNIKRLFFHVRFFRAKGGKEDAYSYQFSF